MWAVLGCALLFAAAASQGTADNERLVTLRQQGMIRGFKADNYDVFEFLDVPYATAPVGRDRFKAPLSPPIIMGTHDAVRRGIVCPQVSVRLGSLESYIMQEDCLVANIHVPNTNQTNLPVLVIVHGGAFLRGFGSMQVANGLISSKNIIVVTFNYRLGPHGFLCLGTEDAPGNAGMKDKVALLRWVQNNIASFGGNPDDVTITGCSAGGASVDLLMLSNMTTGLFKKVIVGSGCSANLFSAQINPLQNARNHALNLGFTNVTDISDLAEYYKTTPLLDLIDESIINNKNSYFLFQPCVEKDIGQQRFLEDAPINILRSGNFKKLPVIYGYTKHEGLFRVPMFSEWSVEMNTNFTKFLPADLQFDNEAHKLQVAENIKNFYFGDNLIDENAILGYVDYFTDAMFLSGILRNIALLVKAGHTEVYLYEYSFTYNGSTPIPYTDGLYGADHCDQLAVVTDHFAPESLPVERVNIGKTMRNIVFNFMTTGNPTPPESESTLPTWPPVGPNRAPHYSVGSTIQVEGTPVEARALFWDEIYDNYGATPQPPIDIVEVDPTAPPVSTPQETTESTSQETTELTPQQTTDLSPETTTDDPDEDESITTAEPNSATLTNIFSFRFWILYTVFTSVLNAHFKYISKY